MSDIAIRAENLSKKFFLGERIGFKTFRETLQDAVVSPIRRIISGKANGATVEEKVDTDRQIWALKDVSFEVKHGEVLGIIGPNGAGKSTLLKILSRITEPTGGYAEIRGRVGSLLEVGTGFHPELTGRENVYLNGAILGMSRAEIRRKFDDIVSFAGVEKFIDTPVKRYSSGMQVRLAFAVAAHLDPEILIIDEVLAVGDAEFQKRCLGKMNEVSRSGRTVLFVSHNMAAVMSLCRRVLVIQRGRVLCTGNAEDVCAQYLQLREGGTEINPQVSVREGMFRAGPAVIRDSDGGPPRPMRDASIVVPVHFFRHCSDPNLHIFVQTPEGATVFGFGSGELLPKHWWRSSRDYTFVFSIKNLPLLPGEYSLRLKIRSYSLNFNEYIDRALVFRVLDAPVYGSTPISRYWHGMIAVKASVDVLTQKEKDLCSSNERDAAL